MAGFAIVQRRGTRATEILCAAIAEERVSTPGNPAAILAVALAPTR